MSDDPLDQVNRFVIAVAALVVIFGALLITLLAWGAASGSIDQIEDFTGYLRDHADRDGKVILTLGALIVVLVMATLIIVELTPSPTQKLRVRNVKSGDAVTTTKEIAARIEQEARAVPHVADCAAVVAARGNRVEIVLDLHVGPGADLARTADEACRRAHALVEQQMNIDLVGRPRARIHYRELRLRREQDGQKAPAAARTATGWERPATDEGMHDDRGNADAPEEAQA